MSRAGSRRPLGLRSNAVVFVRVWEYEVPDDRAAAFTTAYAADGAWGELFGRAAGFLGTELYRDAVRADRFLTIDRWRNEEDWQSFLHAFGERRPHAKSGGAAVRMESGAHSGSR